MYGDSGDIEHEYSANLDLLVNARWLQTRVIGDFSVIFYKTPYMAGGHTFNYLLKPLDLLLVSLILCVSMEVTILLEFALMLPFK